MTGRLAGTNGSQFFITTTAPSWLNGNHTIFGEVADDASKAVVDAIEAVPTGGMDRPVDDVVITGVDIAEA
jgi:peptidyl-prolyl cis-trans isomerase A (cyclophilin A)